MRKDLETIRNRMPSAWSSPEMIDQMIERAFSNPFSLLDELRSPVNDERDWFHPTVDLDEREDCYVLSVDLPGVKKEDIKIDVRDNQLFISGERKRKSESDEKGIRRFESSYGRFQRRFTLPMSVDANKVEADLTDGVLYIALPKVEVAKPKSVEIQSGTGFFSKLLGKSSEGKKDRTQDSTTH